MKAFSAGRITQAVCAICPDIEERIANGAAELNERCLWWELSACVLSSQVSYPLASEAASAIDVAGHLFEPDCLPDLSDRLSGILRRPLPATGRNYRFPSTRAQQLATTKKRVIDRFGTLSALLTKLETPVAARDWLVDYAPGLGPKQSSMFLRNSGFSYDLAILDRHVLNYMELTGLRAENSKPIATMREYRLGEESMRGHARELGFPVGILDWAIWIVMRVARTGERARA
jgi:N-glycosylase/DNA lyase